MLCDCPAECYAIALPNVMRTMCRMSCEYAAMSLEGKDFRNLGAAIARLGTKVNSKLICEAKHPNEERSFGEKIVALEGFRQIKRDYFGSISRFYDNLVGVLSRDDNETRSAMFDIRCASLSLVKMQAFFEEISTGQESLMKQHIQLCDGGLKNIQNLMMACMYYNEHQAIRHIRKYNIQGWYIKKQRQTMKNAENMMIGLSEKYKVTFPQTFYYGDNGVLSYYPIIVSGLNAEDSAQLLAFCCSCITFQELGFDYMMIFKNEQGKIMPQCLSITKISFIN